MVAEFRAFKEWTKDMLTEREKLGIERANRIDARIDSVEKATSASFQSLAAQTSAAFNSSQLAIDKSDMAKKEHDERANGLAETLRKNTETYPSKEEVKKDLEHIHEQRESDRKEYETYKIVQAQEIRTLRESRSMIEGRGTITAIMWAVVASVGISVVATLILRAMKV